MKMNSEYFVALAQSFEGSATGWSCSGHPQGRFLS